MSEDPLWDKARGELRILGQRHVAVNVQTLCDRLDLIVGPHVAEVIMNQHESRQGKEDAARCRQQEPLATVEELVSSFANAETLAGVGVVRVAIPRGSPSPIDLEVSNPCVKRTTGAAKSFIFSYWCGIFTQLVGKEFKIESVSYDQNRNLLKGRIVPR